jgi:hypothetical protein
MWAVTQQVFMLTCTDERQKKATSPPDL